MAKEEEGDGVLSIPDAIMLRTSVRSFRGLLSPDRAAVVERIVAEAQQISTPFSTNAEIGLHGPGLGRLVINHEAGWLIAKIPQDQIKSREHLIDAAYRLHVAVINLTQHRLGTVWIAGTYKAAKAEASVPGFKVPAVVAYGEPAEKTGLVERFFKWVSDSRSRKPLSEIFFEGESKTPINEASAGERLPLLKALQAAPSARNLQPWRFVLSGDSIHLSNADPKSGYTAFDMGIALATAKLFLEATGKSVRFSKITDQQLGEGYEATITFQ
jgi:hypothetical protein